MEHYYQEMDMEDEPEEICLASMCIKTGALIGVHLISMETLHSGTIIPHGVYGTAYEIFYTRH